MALGQRVPLKSENADIAVELELGLRPSPMLHASAARGLLAGLVISGHASLGWFVALQAVHGAAPAVFNPAMTGVMRGLAAGDALQQANSVRGIGEAAGNLAGPALVGLLVVAGAGLALAADAATFTVSAACLLAIRTVRASPAAAHPGPTGSPVPPATVLQDLWEGWQQFRARTWVWSIVCSAAVQNLLYSSFFVLGPIQPSGTITASRAGR